MNEFVHIWFPAVAFVLSAAAVAMGFFVHSVAQSRDTALAAELYGRINAQDARLTKIEVVIDNLPQRQDVHDIALTCGELVGEMKALKAEMTALHDAMNATQASVHRINDYLMERRT